MDASIWYDAAVRQCPPDRLELVIDGINVAIEVAGPQLARQLFTPFAHLRRAPEADGPAQVRIHAFSEAETGIQPPADQPNPWYDAGAGVAFCHFRDAAMLRRIDVARPFQKVLVNCLAAQGRMALHAALVAPPGTRTGLLLVGPNGAGKSTTCLSALQAGFSMVADDCLVLGTGRPVLEGHSLFRSCCLTEQSERLFPTLPGRLWTPPSPDYGPKRVLMLSDGITATSMAAILPMAALVFPVILNKPVASTLTPIGRGEAQRRLMPAARLLNQLTVEARIRAFAALDDLPTGLPAFRLDMGTDITALPPLLTRLAYDLMGEAAA